MHRQKRCEDHTAIANDNEISLLTTKIDRYYKYPHFVCIYAIVTPEKQLSNARKMLLKNCHLQPNLLLNDNFVGSLFTLSAIFLLFEFSIKKKYLWNANKNPSFSK